MLDDSRAVRARIAMRLPPFWTPWMTMSLAGAAGAAGGSLLFRLQDGHPPAPRDLLVFLLILLAASSITLLVRWRTRPRSTPAIILGPDRVSLPVAFHSQRARDVPYADVLSVDVIGDASKGQLFVNTRRKLFAYPLRMFDHADPVAALRTSVRTALESQGARQLIRQMDAREDLAREAAKRRPVITYALLASIGIVFLVEMALGATERTFDLVKYGANAPALVWAGQWFRLFSANFLHLNLLHVYMNAIALFALGFLLERLVGRWRFLAIYLLAALGGALTSALVAQAALSVGASTALFGLLGSLAVLNWKYRAQLSSGLRQTPVQWIVIVAVNVALALWLPAIDFGAHVGGALVGAAITLLLYRGVDVIRVDAPARQSLRVVVSLIVAGFAAALTVAGFHSRESTADQDSRTVARAFVNSPATKPSALNNFAWSVYLDDQASAADLDLALLSAQMAVAHEHNPEFLDTQAGLLFRTGQLDEAVYSELRAIELLDKRFYWEQLTRFLARRMKIRGPLISGDEAATPRLSTIEGGALQVELPDATDCAQGCTLYALARVGQAVVGIVQLRIGAGVDRVVRLNPADLSGAATLPRDFRLDLALVESGPCAACRANEVRGRYEAGDGSPE